MFNIPWYNVFYTIPEGINSKIKNDISNGVITEEEGHSKILELYPDIYSIANIFKGLSIRMKQSGIIK